MAKKGRNSKTHRTKETGFNYFKDISFRNAKVKRYLKEKEKDKA